MFLNIITTMKVLHIIAFILVVVGGLNWGLVGLGNWNVVNMILGSMPVVERVVYVLVGLSTLLILLTHKGSCRVCSNGV